MGGCVSSDNSTLYHEGGSKVDYKTLQCRVAAGVIGGHFMDGFSESKEKMSVGGVQARGAQRGFENKNVDCCGVGDWLEKGIGFSCKKGLKPDSPNQDDFFIMAVDGWSMYGVFDGHGPNGHIVSNFIESVLPRLIAADPLLWIDPKETLRKNFIIVHELLEKSNICDAQVSGSTCTVVIRKGEMLYSAHVGDSRAVLAVADSSMPSGYRALDLTEDHKPNLEIEKKRIFATGGQIRRLDGDIPYRVFVKGKQYPGLAMSRAIGDLIGTQAGVIPEPEVSECILSEESDIFVLLCSDGVWEFISSQEAVDMVARRSRKNVCIYKYMKRYCIYIYI
eukprot:GHVL01020748.1.p1 GENE.GHVL01020748.1~~GHVL01020748.1.p1  ORF type:complete len:368 (+),score=55.11 GHVL01020748.1:100-1104(+)